MKIQIYLKKKGIVFGKADPIKGYTRKEKEISSKIKEETVLTNLLLEESEVAIDEEEAKKFGIDSKNLEYGNNIASEIYLEKEKDNQKDNDKVKIEDIDIEGKPISVKKEVLENIHDEGTKVVHEKKNILYMSLMIIEVILLILVVSYAIIRVKKPEILKYFTFIPVEKVLALDKVKEENTNNNTSTDKNGVKIAEEESKYNIILKIDGKEYKVVNNAKKIAENVVLLGTRTEINPEKQHLSIASENVEGRLQNLDKLKKGEKIVLVINGKEYTYEINSVKKVDSESVDKIEDKNKKELTIITNAEEGKRVIIYAK